MGSKGKDGFIVRIPARLLKDKTLRRDAKLLYCILSAYADARSGETYVSPSTIERQMHSKRAVRERAQRELVTRGLLQIKRERGAGGRLGRNNYKMLRPCQNTIAHNSSTGTNAQLTSAGKTGTLSTSVPQKEISDQLFGKLGQVSGQVMSLQRKKRSETSGAQRRTAPGFQFLK